MPRPKSKLLNRWFKTVMIRKQSLGSLSKISSLRVFVPNSG